MSNTIDIQEVQDVYTEDIPDEPEDDWEEYADDIDPDDEEFIDQLTKRIMIFMEALCDIQLYPYQKDIAYRVIQSVLLNDGATLTVLCARQSGKSAALGSVISTLMVIMPRLALTFPDRFSMYRKGFWVGIFAPTEDQAFTVWDRVHTNLTSKEGRDILGDEEIDDRAVKEGSKIKVVKLVNSGSLCRMQTANPKAQIESKTYHFVLVDEAQDCDDYKVNKSIHPMRATTNGTMVYTGTPTRRKNFFYESIQLNKRLAIRGRKRPNHFQYDDRTVVKYNHIYKKFIAGEKERIGEDSDEFQMSYRCKWMLEQGMYVTEDKLSFLGDPTMEAMGWWAPTPVVVGIDVARTKDSTVVTVMWVDWDMPDPYGFCQHRILNWLEIHNKEWETQYAKILDFLSRYNVLRIGVDAQGMGSAVAERLQHEMPWVEVVPLPSDAKNQEERWKYMTALIERKKFIYPAGKRTKRTKNWKKFYQQMIDLETVESGKYLLAAAPDTAHAHDDFPDSACNAAFMSKVAVEQPVIQMDNFLYSDVQRRAPQRGHQFYPGSQRDALLRGRR